jgi:hypothetical protein
MIGPMHEAPDPLDAMRSALDAAEKSGYARGTAFIADLGPSASNYRAGIVRKKTLQLEKDLALALKENAEKDSEIRRLKTELAFASGRVKKAMRELEGACDL